MNETNKRRLLVVSIVITSIPALLLMSPPARWSLASGALYLSAVTGYLGVALILWMYILGMRSVFGLIFHDIAPIMKIHRWLGTYGAIAILLHPILIILNYGESIFYTIIPHVGTAFERHVTLGRSAFIVFAVVWISSALLRKKIAYRPWKYLHYLSYICLPFALLHIPSIGSQFMSQTFVQSYFYAILTVFILVTLMRVRGFIDGDRFDYSIARHNLIADNVYQLDLDPATASWPTPKPGQYVYLKLGRISEDHPFSVVTSNPVDGRITLAYRGLGRFTSYMSEQKSGTRVLISRGYGEFLQSFADTRPTVFIAGGIGITPFIETIAQHSSNDNVWLFYSNRAHSTSAFLPQLKSMLGSRAVSIFNQEHTTEPYEENGYLSAEIVRKYLPDPTLYQYYICGPAIMMDSTIEVLSSLDVPSRQIRTEAFNF